MRTLSTSYSYRTPPRNRRTTPSQRFATAYLMSPQSATASAGGLFHVKKKIIHNLYIRRSTTQSFCPDVNQSAVVLSCRIINRLIPRVLQKTTRSTDIGSCRTQKQRYLCQTGSTRQSNLLTLANKILQSWKFNPLNTKRRLLYLNTQFVPRSKHFSSRL